MTDSELRMKVAEALGWSVKIIPANQDWFPGYESMIEVHDPSGIWYCASCDGRVISPGPFDAKPRHMPNWPTDLNACAELLNILYHSKGNVVMRTDGDGDWLCASGEGGEYVVMGDTSLARAICLAFLEAVKK